MSNESAVSGVLHNEGSDSTDVNVVGDYESPEFYQGKFVSITSILVSVFVGGPLAGVWLFAHNERSFGNKKRSVWILVVGVITTIILIWGLLQLQADLLRSIPMFAGPIMLGVLFWAFCQAPQQNRIHQAVKQRGEKAYAGYIVAVVVGSMILSLGPLWGIEYGTPLADGYEVILLGEQEHILYYKDTDLQIAEEIGQSLFDLWYLDRFDYSSHFYVDREGEIYRLLLPFEQDYWDRPEVNQDLWKLQEGIKDKLNIKISVLFVNDSWTGWEVQELLLPEEDR